MRSERPSRGPMTGSGATRLVIVGERRIALPPSRVELRRTGRSSLLRGYYCEVKEPMLGRTGIGGRGTDENSGSACGAAGACGGGSNCRGA
jgi:hypothetical protein